MAVAVHEIGEQFFLLRSGETDFHRNLYVKRFIGNGEQINMICDPGTKIDMPMLIEGLEKLIGGMHNLHIIFLSHQDPDVSSNAPALLQLAPRASLITSIDTWRLVKMYGIAENRFHAAEGFKSSLLVVKSTGHRIKLVPAHYCHFRGALMFYDLASRVLFTGDFLGGLNTRKGDGVLADESSWEGISLFHQVYMPTRQAISATIDRISLLNPPPTTIAPQHGDVITGEFVTEFAARLAVLDVAVDVTATAEPQKDLVLLCLNDYLDSLRARDAELHQRLVQELEAPHGFTTFFRFFSGSMTDVKVAAPEALAVFWRTLDHVAPPASVQGLKALLVSSIEQFSLTPPPEILTEGEASSGPFDELDVAPGEPAIHAL